MLVNNRNNSASVSELVLIFADAPMCARFYPILTPRLQTTEVFQPQMEEEFEDTQGLYT